MAYVKSARRVFKRVAKKAYRAVKKRYYSKKSGIKFRAIARDVERLKNVINAELKFYNVELGVAAGADVGQFSGNSAGGLWLDVTPKPAQGTTDITRVGDSIRPRFCTVHLQCYQQSACTNPIKFKVVFLKSVGQTYSTAAIMTDTYYDNSPWTGVVDYNSMKDKDHALDIAKIYERRYVLNETTSSQVAVKDIQFNLQMSKDYHVKFDDNSTNVARGQIIMVILCDQGNCSTTTTTTNLGAISTAINTGMHVRYQLRWQYYDN